MNCSGVVLTYVLNTLFVKFINVRENALKNPATNDINVFCIHLWFILLHPRMLIKTINFDFPRNVFSKRKLTWVCALLEKTYPRKFFFLATSVLGYVFTSSLSACVNDDGEKKLRKSSQQGRAHIVQSHVVLRYSNNAIRVIVKKFCQKLWSEQIFLCYHLQCTICRKLHELNWLFSLQKGCCKM